MDALHSDGISQFTGELEGDEQTEKPCTYAVKTTKENYYSHSKQKETRTNGCRFGKHSENMSTRIGVIGQAHHTTFVQGFMRIKRKAARLLHPNTAASSNQSDQ